MSRAGKVFSMASCCAVSILVGGLTIGCGMGPAANGSYVDGGSVGTMSGILHGGPNPIVGATVTLYVTQAGAGYGGTATAVTTAITGGTGNFTFTLPTGSAVCPAGSFAYVAAYGGVTGAHSSNSAVLLMDPIGACSTNYSYNSTTGVNSYSGLNLWVNELTTAVSAYALGGFMSVTNAGVVNIGAPTNNTATAAIGTPGGTGQAAAGLAHAFANALAIVNISTGQPYAYTNGGTSAATGGVIPDAELFLLANILQACVNSNGTTGTNTAAANDGSACGQLFSLTTPPQSGAAMPANTLQAMVDLAKYPNNSMNYLWNNTTPACTSSVSSSTSNASYTNTGAQCLFAVSPSIGAAYGGSLAAAPPDWALAVVYKSGYGAGTVATTNPGLGYPYYVALDYEDNVYVLNWNTSPATQTNIIGLTNSGAPLFSTTADTTNTLILQIGTDTAGHVFGAENGGTSGENILIYNTGVVTGTTAGSLLTTATYNNGAPKAVVADPFDNIYVASTNGGINLRVLKYTAGTGFASTVTTATNTGPVNNVYQIGIDSNYDIYEVEDVGTTTTTAYVAVNTSGSLTVAPTLNKGSSYNVATTFNGSSTNALGIAVAGTNAYVVNGSGVTPFTLSTSGTPSLTAGTTTSWPSIYNNTLYSRYAYTDGNSWVYSPEGANGEAVTGVDVFDTTDGLALGIYKGCYVTSTGCGTTSPTSPIFSPRGAGLDSSGDIWVVSGANGTLAELIGAAAPSWPGLSMAKSGLPQ